MCYQCSGCGRCLEAQNGEFQVVNCPCCRREVEQSLRYCPTCGAFIRPKAGSYPNHKKSNQENTAPEN